MRVAVPGGASGAPFHLNLERSGPAGAPSILLVHGLADDHGLWRHVVPRLARRWDVVAVDMPGHGASDPVPDGATIDWFADVVGGLIPALDLREPVLVGLSMGGGVVQYVALDPPRPIRGLVLVSTSPVFPEATRRRFTDRAAVAEREGMTAVVDATVPRWFTADWMTAHPDEVDATRATVLATDPISFARASRANAARDCADRLGEIECPVLFIAGADDPADPGRAEAIYRERVPDLRVVLLPRLSHLLPVEAPDRFTDELERFLEGLPG